MNRGEAIIAREHTSHLSNIKPWTAYRFVADSYKLTRTRLI